MIWITNSLATRLSLTAKQAHEFSKPYDKEAAKPTAAKSKVHTAMTGHRKSKMDL